MINKTNRRRSVGFFAKLGELIRGSMLIGALLDAENVSRTRGRSLFNRFLSANAAKRFLLRVKLSVGAAVENSMTLYLFDKAEAAVLGSSLRSVSLFSFTFGAFIAAAEALMYPQQLFSLRFSGTFLLGVILILVSLFLFPFSKRTVASALRESTLLAFFLGDGFSYLPREQRKIMPTTELSVLGGLICGVLSVTVTAKRVIVLLIMLAAVYLIFRKPENGFLLLACIAPFIGERYRLYIMLITVLSALLKLLRGKRAMRGRRLDTLFWILLCCIIPAGAVSYDPASFSRAGVYLIIVLYALTLLTLINSTDLVSGIMRNMTVSAVLAALYALIRMILVLIDTPNVPFTLPYLMDTFRSFCLPSSADAFAAYMLCVIPLSFARERVVTPVIDSLSFLVLAAALLFAGRLDAVLIFLGISVLIVAVRSRTRRRILLCAAAAVCAVCLLLPRLTNRVIGYIGSVMPQMMLTDASNGAVLPAGLRIAGSGLGYDAVDRALFYASPGVQTAAGNSYHHLLARFGLIGGSIVLLCLLPFMVRIILGAASHKEPYPVRAERISAAMLCSVVCVLLFAFRVNLFTDTFSVTVLLTLLVCGAVVTDTAQKEFIVPYLPREEFSHGESPYGGAFHE